MIITLITLELKNAFLPKVLDILYATINFYRSHL